MQSRFWTQVGLRVNLASVSSSSVAGNKLIPSRYFHFSVCKVRILTAPSPQGGCEMTGHRERKALSMGPGSQKAGTEFLQ